jgi:hypothetical protein
MKILIKILPIEFFHLKLYTESIANMVKNLPPNYRHISDILIWEFWETLEKQAWAWKQKHQDKPYSLKIDYSEAKVLGKQLLENCPTWELQMILSKLHKALVDQDGLLLESSTDKPP